MNSADGLGPQELAALLGLDGAGSLLIPGLEGILLP
jgi:hypothetical protein